MCCDAAVIPHQSAQKVGDREARRAFAIPCEELWNGSSRKFEFFAPPGCRWRIEAICHYFAFDIKRGGAKEMIPHAFACVRDAAAEREQERVLAQRARTLNTDQSWMVQIIPSLDAMQTFTKPPSIQRERTLRVIDQRQENTRHKEKSPLLSE
jgi:hypothetical protein